MRFLERTLAEHGLFLHLANLTLGEASAPPDDGFHLSRNVEEKLLNGVAWLLRTAVRP